MIIADTLNDCRRKLTLDGTISTLAGLGSGYDGLAAQASFNNPVGIAIDAEGNIADADNKALRKLTPDGTVSTLAGSADFQWSRSNDCVPRGVAIDAEGNVFVTPDCASYICNISPAGVVCTVAIEPKFIENLIAIDEHGDVVFFVRGEFALVTIQRVEHERLPARWTQPSPPVQQRCIAPTI